MLLKRLNTLWTKLFNCLFSSSKHFTCKLEEVLINLLNEQNNLVKHFNNTHFDTRFTNENNHREYKKIQITSHVVRSS